MGEVLLKYGLTLEEIFVNDATVLFWDDHAGLILEKYW